MSTTTVLTPVKVESAFDDPHALRALIERHGPYRLVANYLPQSSELAVQASAGPETFLPWFRGNWAFNGRPLVDGADPILHNPRFIETASRLFDTQNVTPTNVFVNVNAPMPAGPVHADIPSFRGATRDRYSMGLLQAMGASGLFEHWRVIEAGAIAWFYDGPGGAYDYWPQGLAGPMRSERPPFWNVALVADNDRMYHRIGWIGDPAAQTPAISGGALIRHLDTGGWEVIDQGETRARYTDEQIRLSIVWKARVHAQATGERGSQLSPELVVEIFRADLRRRGIDTPLPASPLSDEIWISLLHKTYYTPVVITARSAR
jgi:hypothetical protein